MTDRRTIGESMRRCRVLKGMSVRELAEAAGVSKATIYHSERDYTYPGILTLTACADVLGITLDEYVGRAEVVR